MARFDLTFSFRNATKGALRYEEDIPEGHTQVIGGLYIRKAAIPGQQPAKLSVTIQTSDQ